MGVVPRWKDIIVNEEDKVLVGDNKRPLFHIDKQTILSISFEVNASIKNDGAEYQYHPETEIPLVKTLSITEGYELLRFQHRKFWDRKFFDFKKQTILITVSDSEVIFTEPQDLSKGIDIPLELKNDEIMKKKIHEFTITINKEENRIDVPVGYVTGSKKEKISFELPEETIVKSDGNVEVPLIIETNHALAINLGLFTFEDAETREKLAVKPVDENKDVIIYPTLNGKQRRVYIFGFQSMGSNETAITTRIRYMGSVSSFFNIQFDPD
ncbi:MAG: hypothetical protein ACFFD4_40735 [Candidatus Odinarchaeota archaeon]